MSIVIMYASFLMYIFLNPCSFIQRTERVLFDLDISTNEY